ncbi:MULTISPECIES: sigma-70 family RNA polymerase sigma factor [unclassified Corynebacterium]|uniref:sigma-70 family RNA polymerase sigma factor n=1 Tax=unclassified Corynebacterium TaxID=2624378 RepID=UPI0029C9C69A|nr:MULTISPECIES: sigma-70 family RNA polymerase sigma factor [unclassified Corynebacterium]WPF66150.1 sigma-70 family RNA polymerase sigma factor [Corynebacterium sp. 22KM0430]WPF68642.1 sigma-70 family RNA polymerase sigma factor [Corynebacterium sp. 21KM1197]
MGEYLAGEASAFTEIVARHGARLLRVARRYGRNEYDAHDIVQEALLRASQNLHTFRRESALGTWLHRLVANSGYDFAHHRHQREVAALDDDSHAPQDMDVRLAYEPLSGIDTRLTLQSALARVHPDQAAALVLIDAAGYSVAHVAELAGVQPGTVKSRRARAKAALRDLMGSAEE